MYLLRASLCQPCPTKQLPEADPTPRIDSSSFCLDNDQRKNRIPGLLRVPGSQDSRKMCLTSGEHFVTNIHVVNAENWLTFLDAVGQGYN